MNIFSEGKCRWKKFSAKIARTDPAKPGLGIFFSSLTSFEKLKHGWGRKNVKRFWEGDVKKWKKITKLILASLLFLFSCISVIETVPPGDAKFAGEIGSGAEERGEEFVQDVRVIGKCPVGFWKKNTGYRPMRVMSRALSCVKEIRALQPNTLGSHLYCMF